MRLHKRFLFAFCLALLMRPIPSSYAQQDGELTNNHQIQKILDATKEMSKGSGQIKGMDEKTQEQLENMFKDMGQKMDERQETQNQKEQERFESSTVGHGTAIVEIEGERYDLTVTKCELWGGGSRKFHIEARLPPARGEWNLSMRADKNSRVGLTFQAGRKGYWREQSGPPDDSSSLAMQHNGLQWQGLVGEEETIPAAIHVSCGAELQNYSHSAKSRQNTPPSVLILSLGDETHPFRISYCSTKAYRTGNLIVDFDVTATGTFRDRPAVVLLSKSHHVGNGARYFEKLELLLGELTKEQRLLAPWKINQVLDQKINAFSSRALSAIQKKYEKKMEAIQEQYGEDIPQDKMLEAMEAMNKITDAQGKELEKVQEQVKAMRFPEARSDGAVTIDGKAVLYKGPKLRTVYGKDAPEFRNLEGKPEVRLSCGEKT